MLKRKLALALSVLMATSTFVGCGSNQGSTTTNETKATTAVTEAKAEETKSSNDGAAEDEKIVIKYLDSYGAMTEEMIAVYETLNPNIEVEYEYAPSDVYYAKFTALNVAGELPDVVMTNTQFIGDQIKSNLLLEITDELASGQNYEEDAIWGETFNETLLANCGDIVKAIGKEYEGQMYAVPFTVTTVAAIYDKNAFDELGIKAPTTWEEFESNNEIIKAAGKIPVSMQQQNMDWWPRILWDQYCRTELENNRDAFEDGTMTFGTESVRQGLEKFKYMWDQGWFPESGLTGNRETIQQLFVQGELLQAVLLPNYMEYLTENVPDSIELGSFAIPGVAGEETRSLGGSSSMLCVTESSQHKEEAMRFVKFMTSKTAFAEEYARFINSGLVNIEASTDTASMEGFVAAGESGFIPDIYVPTNITTQIQNAFLTDLIPNYLLGTYDIEYVIEQLDALYKETYLDEIAN